MFLESHPFALRSARVRSAAAVASGAALQADRADLEQEVLARLWQALSIFDPTRAGLRTFIELIVRTQFISMVRSHSRRCELESLDDQIVEGDGRFREIELSIDVSRALAGVSLFDRTVALSLTECSVVETSRGMCVSRAAVYRAIGGLRLALSELGFAGRHRRWAACRRNSDPRSRTGQTEVRL